MSPLLPVTNTNSFVVVVCIEPVLSKSNAEDTSDSAVRHDSRFIALNRRIPSTEVLFSPEHVSPHET